MCRWDKQIEYMLESIGSAQNTSVPELHTHVCMSVRVQHKHDYVPELQNYEYVPDLHQIMYLCDLYKW